MSQRMVDMWLGLILVFFTWVAWVLVYTKIYRPTEPLAIVTMIDKKSGTERSWRVKRFVNQTADSVTFETTDKKTVTLNGPLVIEK